MMSVSVSFAYSVIDGTVVQIDLQQDTIVSSLAPAWTAMPLKDLAEQVNGTIAMNAGYFCPEEVEYTWCGGGNKTTSDRIYQGVVYSKYKKDTWARGIMGFTKDNEALFVQNNFGYVPGSYEGNTNQERFDDIYYGIGNFPILLDQWADVVSEFDDVIDHKMKNKSTKGFICHTADKRYVYMGFIPNKTIYEMPAYIEEAYGCYNAINLDAGGSAGLYENGKYLLTPGRNVVDAFVVIPGGGNGTTANNDQSSYVLTSVDRAIVAKIKQKNLSRTVLQAVLTKLSSKKEAKWIRIRAIVKAAM